jgi:hypothetical protein
LENKLQVTFGTGGNAKLAKNIATFSIPSGFTCPGADACLARADPDTGKITDGAQQKFRCFSASQEAVFPNVRNSRWRNFQALKQAGSVNAMRDLLLHALPGNHDIVRIHVAGDFFSQAYFDAWLAVAAARADLKFYAYTKSLRYWVNRLASIPSNLSLIASRGGKFDQLIDMHELPQAVVVFHPEEAEALGLEIDEDDRHAMQGQSFALLLHGSQAAKSTASAAVSRMRKESVKFSYAR